jgi:alkyldihydroxyacetonephosphate synthase
MRNKIIKGCKMRRWNGWGDENTSMELPQSAGEFLSTLVGAGHRLEDIGLAEVINTVPVYPSTH